MTNEDHKILLYVEKFGSITINQCQSMYYNTQSGGYVMASRHLTRLVASLKLKVFREPYSKKNVYYNTKKPSYHTILIQEYYAQLIRSGVFINYFKREQSWLNNKYYSDGFCMYCLGNNVYFDAIEVIRTKGVEKKKYIEIYDSKEAHELSDELYSQIKGSSKRDLFPRLILIDNVKHKKPLFINDNVNVIQLDFNLSDFSKVFV